MAKFCDEQAAVFGEVAPPPPQDVAQDESNRVVKEKDGEGGKVEICSVQKELADRAAIEGGDCCVPKKLTFTES